MFHCINLCFLCSVRIFISQVTGGLSVVEYYITVASVLHRLCCIHLCFYINQVLLSQALSEQVLAHGN